MLKSISKYIFFFAIFFPYIKIIPVEGVGDTQPVALAVGLIFFFYCIIVKKELVPKQFGYFLITLCVAVAIFLISDISFTVFRSLVGYISLFFLGCASYFLLKRNNGISDNFIKFVILIWGIVGLIQAFINRNFLSFLMFRFSSDLETGRGVLGLAPEPTYYGTICIFLLFYSIFHLKSYWYSFFLLFQIIFLAKSSMAVLVLGAILAVYLFVYKKFVTGGLFVLFFVFVGAIIINTSYFQGSRMAHLFGKAQEGSMIFEEDGSANDRLAAIAFSVKGCIDHWGMPGGMGTYTDYVEKELPNQSFFRYGGGRGRIMSGYGSALYELGILGLFIPIAFLVVICHYFKQDKKKQIVVFIAFTMLMFTAIPLALPYVSFFYGYLIYYTKNAK